LPEESESWLQNQAGAGSMPTTPGARSSGGLAANGPCWSSLPRRNSINQLCT